VALLKYFTFFCYYDYRQRSLRICLRLRIKFGLAAMRGLRPYSGRTDRQTTLELFIYSSGCESTSGWVRWPHTADGSGLRLPTHINRLIYAQCALWCPCPESNGIRLRGGWWAVEGQGRVTEYSWPCSTLPKSLVLMVKLTLYGSPALMDSNEFFLNIWAISVCQLLHNTIIPIPQNLYGALYKQNSAKGAWQ